MWLGHMGQSGQMARLSRATPSARCAPFAGNCLTCTAPIRRIAAIGHLHLGYMLPEIYCECSFYHPEQAKCVLPNDYKDISQPSQQWHRVALVDGGSI